MGTAPVEWYSQSEEGTEIPLKLFLTELDNGILLVISDKGPKIGTIAIGIPDPSIKGRINTSSIPIVFGFRNELFTRALAERIAHRTQKIIIASVFLSVESMELAQRAIKFTEETIQQYLDSKKEL